jgi:predicted NAD/FAD-binding protein
MTSKRLILSALLFALFLIACHSQVVIAQTDLELYEKYIQKNNKSQTLLSSYRDGDARVDSGYVILHESAYQTLYELIKDKSKQTSVVFISMQQIQLIL